MSSRSLNLRNHAGKCEWHAQNMGDTETQVKLRKLAAQYLAKAEDIEGNESDALTSQSSGEAHRPEQNAPQTTTPPAEYDRWTALD